jgi:hypothetical protein
MADDAHEPLGNNKVRAIIAAASQFEPWNDADVIFQVCKQVLDSKNLQMVKDLLDAARSQPAKAKLVNKAEAMAAAKAHQANTAEAKRLDTVAKAAADERAEAARLA